MYSHDFFEATILPACQIEIEADQFPAMWPDTHPPSSLGASLAVGDFDGDGLDDLVVGAPHTRVDGRSKAGAAYVLFGQSNLADPSSGTYFSDASSAHLLHQNAFLGTGSVADQPDWFDRFASALAVGDFDCDGLDDLVVGVPRENDGGYSDVGAVHVLYGSPDPDSELFRQNRVFYGSAAADQYFGAALAVGRFNDASWGSVSCDSLAVGMPGRNIGTRTSAGAVYVYLAEAGSLLSSTNLQVITQYTSGVGGSPGTNDLFGATLGTMDGYNGSIDQDGLWIGVDDRTDFWSCHEPEHRPFHRLGSDADGIAPSDGDERYCGMFSPNVLQQRRVMSEINTGYGPVVFFVPGNDVANVGALIHGTYGSDDENGSECSRSAPVGYFANNGGTLNQWADFLGVAMITPAVNHNDFGNNRNCMTPYPPSQPYYTGLGWSGNGKGYRALFGNAERPNGDVWAFDDWLNFIIDELAKIDDDFENPMHMFGHSGGGQFVARYLWEHAENLQSVVVSSAGGLPSPDSSAPWPGGMGEYSEPQFWPGWDGTEADVFYDPEDATTGGDTDARWRWIVDNIRVHVVAGSEEPNKVSSHSDWVTALNGIPGVTDHATFCSLIGADHGERLREEDPYGNPYGDEIARQLFLGLVDLAGSCDETIR